MPWNNPNDFSLDEHHVAACAPAAPGILYIHNGKQHIYLVGVSNIKLALLRIVGGQVPCVLKKAPLRFSYQQTNSTEETIDLALKLAAELKPVCNPGSLN
jgi:hypothetical protein